MKIQCLLVDDEPLAISLLQKHLQQMDYFEVVGTCNNALKALEFLKSRQVDLLFLDIKMPKISGLDLLKTLKNSPKTIITTAYREYALEGYDLDIVDYLLKPITFDRFFKAIERYLRNANQEPPAVLPSAEGKAIYLKSGTKHIRLDMDEILFVESLKDYIKVHVTTKQVIVKYKISDFEKAFELNGFLRVHRSFIVNLKKITAYTANDIEIGSKLIPIGFSYKEYVFKTLSNSPRP